MVFMIDGIRVELAAEGEAIRLTTNCNDNLLLPSQTMALVQTTVTGNLRVVRPYYLARAGVAVDALDLSVVSLKIVLHYLYVHNMWRNLYVHQKDRDLGFMTDDLERPYTHDIAISYFRNKYPHNYSAKCELLLGMPEAEFKAYEKGRQDFAEMW